ncbi:TorF family putative porin [Sphingomonas oligophenolica]|uniref:Porin n=1 Tax=Sphingomonas oligophenolica TaxID=301154 RepID=A0A502BW92_9SPHN|nr:TorF family putative porin [Sphingomonas oligophenolica]TPG04728.1 hypothetical protein EAH84_15315 [Sphingomonas oligophenolica]
MYHHIAAAAALVASALTASATHAQETAPPKPVTVSGSVALVSDYRFRGVSQTDKEGAIQGGLTVAHRSGFYAGAWASNLAGWGTFGGSNTELDLIGGYTQGIGNGTIDVGLTWYMYPGGADKTDFAEPYAKVSGTIGPVGLLAGVAYAPPQQALGRWYFIGTDAASGIYNDPGGKDDNLYLRGEANVGIPHTPVTAKAHIGYSDGNPGLGPNGTSIAPTGRYFDWMLGADYVLGPVTLGIAYVDTDIDRSESAYLIPNFGSTKNGSSIAESHVVFSVGASF